MLIILRHCRPRIDDRLQSRHGFVGSYLAASAGTTDLKNPLNDRTELAGNAAGLALSTGDLAESWDFIARGSQGAFLLTLTEYFTARGAITLVLHMSDGTTRNHVIAATGGDSATTGVSNIIYDAFATDQPGPLVTSIDFTSAATHPGNAHNAGAFAIIAAHTGLVIRSTTVLTAPEAANDRTTIGVNEKITFTVEPSMDVAWEIEEGDAAVNRNSNSYPEYQAADTAGVITVTATADDGSTATLTITVVTPTGFSVSEIEEFTDSPDEPLTAPMNKNTGAFNPQAVGAGAFITEVHLLPRTVNFGFSDWREVSGPATNIQGHFGPPAFTQQQLFHTANDWVGIFQETSSVYDDAAIVLGTQALGTSGSFTWTIPNRYRRTGGGGDGHHFLNTEQIFTLFGNDRMTIHKFGEIVADRTRTP